MPLSPNLSPPRAEGRKRPAMGIAVGDANAESEYNRHMHCEYNMRAVRPAISHQLFGAGG